MARRKPISAAYRALCARFAPTHVSITVRRNGAFTSLDCRFDYGFYTDPFTRHFGGFDAPDRGVAEAQAWLPTHLAKLAPTAMLPDAWPA